MKSSIDNLLCVFNEIIFVFNCCLFKVPPFSWWLSLSRSVISHARVVVSDFLFCSSPWTDHFVYRHELCFIFRMCIYTHVFAKCKLDRSMRVVNTNIQCPRHFQTMDEQTRVVSTNEYRRVLLPWGGWTLMLRARLLYCYLIAIDDRWLWLEIVTFIGFLWCLRARYMFYFITYNDHKGKSCMKCRSSSSTNWQ